MAEGGEEGNVLSGVLVSNEAKIPFCTEEIWNYFIWLCREAEGV
jgi:hypothetical protein